MPEVSDVPDVSDVPEVPDVSLERRWFPVCRGEEAFLRHIVHTALLGQELAVWRADDGAVNAWVNRCPHRGVRLSVGTNLGDRLKCRYHGWEYESGTAQCVERPAHPGEKPPSIVRARAFPCVEESGYVWVRLSGEDGDDPVPAPGTTQPGLTLRGVHVRAPAAAVADALARHAREGQDGTSVEIVDPYTVCTVDAARPARSGTPSSRSRTTRRSSTPRSRGAPAAADRIAVLRRENDRLRAVRDADRGAARRHDPALRLRALRELLQDPAVPEHPRNLEWETRRIDFHPKREHKSAWFLGINPLGQVPVIEDGDFRLARRPGNPRLSCREVRLQRPVAPDGGREDPRRDRDVARVRRRHHRDRLRRPPPRRTRLRARRRTRRAPARTTLFRVLDEHLWFAEQEGRDWLCGPDHPTIADIACFPYVALSEEGRDLAHALPRDPPLDGPRQAHPGLHPDVGRLPRLSGAPARPFGRYREWEPVGNSGPNLARMPCR